jgi:hypothetical protein
MAADVFTQSQWAAARILIARTRAEAAGQEFDLEQLGVWWTELDDTLCATTDTGIDISVGDVLQASVILLWSAILAASDYAQITPVEVIQRLGLGLAQNEPEAQA